MKKPTPDDVDSYIAAADPEARGKLGDIRDVLRSSVPEAEEGISWGVPFYKYKGPLAGFAAYKKHVSLGFADELHGEDREALEREGFATGKKTMRIAFDQAVPAAAIGKLLRAQAAANEARRES